MDNTQVPYRGVDKSQFNINIPIYLIFTILTCGLFNIYWNYVQMKACNYLLEREEFNFIQWLLLTILTCGIYHIFYQYKMGVAILEVQKRYNKNLFDALPILSCLLTAFGFSIVVDCIHQQEINKLVQ